MKNQAIFMAATVSAVVAGFMVGYGIGKETRSATNENVTSSYDNGVVTIRADVAKTLRDGAINYFNNLVG